MSNLEARISDFAGALRVCAKWHKADNRVAQALCELYATRSANKLLSSIYSLCPAEIEAGRKMVQAETASTRRVLPTPENVHAGAAKLLGAVESENTTETVSALQEIGVLELCPASGKQFDRLEFIVGCVIGRARLVPLAELAIFAAECGAQDRVDRYITEARTLRPGPPELHSLLTAAGIVAIDSGNISEAKDYLLESVRVCSKGGQPCVPSRLRAFHVGLANKLLEHGEEEPVVKYLAHCQVVWSHQRALIAEWINRIRAGERPEFLTSSFFVLMERPGVKLEILTLRAQVLGDTATLEPVEDSGGYEERTVEFQRMVRAAIDGDLGVNKN